MSTQENFRGTTPIVERKLWAGAICARLELYQNSRDEFEIYWSVGNEVPHRFVGPLGLCINKGEHFIAIRKSEGYEEQLPSYYQSSIN